MTTPTMLPNTKDMVKHRRVTEVVSTRQTKFQEMSHSVLLD